MNTWTATALLDRRCSTMLGEKKQAIAWLRRAVTLGNHNYPWFQRDKNYNNLRNDPEYQKIMEEVRDHLEQYRKAVAAG